ncbi:L,D-transpeptidase family protein [Ruminococcus sp.]|uniref:L,D-transpeptidase family protein n=1 Tax=Ruminococcus sp. TaxID=41978 RepID=UPI003864E9A3
MGRGGVFTKNKWIIIGTAVVAAAVAFTAGVLLMTKNITFAPRDLQGAAAAKSVIETPLLRTVTGERAFGASTADEAVKTTAGRSDQDHKTTYTADSIPQVTGLQRLSEKPDSIRIGWDELEGVDGYRIYRRDDNASGADFALFSIAKTAGLDIRNLGTGSKYSFKITPYIKNNGSFIEGKGTEVTFGTAPTDVENFRMTDETKSTISLSWDKNDRADGYLLERCYKGKWSDYQNFDQNTTEFTDTDLEAGRAYYYRICAYREDSTGIMPGAKSAIRTVAGLLGPKDDDSASKLGRVSLDFEESKYADGYQIYYSTDQANWEHLGDTESTHYSTSRLENGKTYYFRIFPYMTVDGHDVTGTYTELSFVANKEIYDKEVGDTYVEVSLDDQHMWYIVDGDVYLDSDCVTGNYGSADTPKGYFEVNAKASPCTLKGDDYTSYVTYWMPFIGGGWGLHDADWRSSFGGNIYKGNGSHGCVNLPPKIAKEMYAVIEVGTPVIVY